MKTNQKEKTTSIKISKFKKIKISKGVVIWTVGATLFGTSLLTIGYLAPKVPVNVDFIITETSITSSSMNYILMPGSTTRFTTPVMESFIGPRSLETNNDGSNTVAGNWNNVINNSTNPNISQDVKDDVELMSKPLVMDVVDSDPWVWDQINSKPQFGKTIDTLDDQDFSLRQAERIIIDNKLIKSLTIQLRDNLVFSNNTDWTSSNAEWLRDDMHSSAQDRVKPSDYAFATQQFLKASNGAANAYMYYKYSNIKNVTECFEGQRGDNDKNGRPTFNPIASSCGIPLASDSFHEKWGKVFIDLDTSETTKDFSPQKKLDYLQTNKSVGIVFSDDLNMIQYNLNQETNYFYSIFLNNVFWPVNKDWYEEKIGSNFFSFGANEDLFMTNGPYYVESFDNKYATYYLKNDNHYAADAIFTNRWMFRVSEETSQQALLFKQGYSSYATLKEDAASFAVDPSLSKYMQPGVEATNTRYLFFNMSDDMNSQDVNKESNFIATSPNRVFTQNINFRKAIFYSYDRTAYMGLSGMEDALPSRMFTASGMGSLKVSEILKLLEPGFESMLDSFPSTLGNSYVGENKGTYNPKETYDKYFKSLAPDQFMDFVDLVSLYALDESKASGKSHHHTLNPWSKPLRNQSFSDITDNRDLFDEYKQDPVEGNEVLVKYYWDKFLSDMRYLNKDVPSLIKLDYITPDANADFSYKSVQEAISKSPTLNGNIAILPRTIPGDPFWAEYYKGTWDILGLRWSPDFKDPWAFLSLIGNYDATRTSNNNGMWNVFAGTKNNPNSGIMGYEEGISNVVNNPNSDLSKRMNPNTYDVYGFGKDKWSKDGVSSNGFTMAELIGSIYVNKSGDNYTKNSSLPQNYSLDSKKLYSLDIGVRYAMMAYFEAGLQDSAAYMVPHAEVITQNASRMFNIYVSSVGYPQYTMAYDVRKAQDGFPGLDELFKWTGK